MFLTGFFWICCIAAMAPALTEAASQAGKFTLPHFPASSNIPIASAVIRPSVFIEKACPNTIVGSQPFNVNGTRHGIKNGKSEHVNSNGNSLLGQHQQPSGKLKDSVNLSRDTKLSLLTNQLSTKKPSKFIKLQKPVLGVKCDISISNKSIPVVFESRNGTQEKNPKCCLEILTMNKGSSQSDVNMGLINANPSVKRDLKGRSISDSHKERNAKSCDDASLLIVNNKKSESGQKNVSKSTEPLCVDKLLTSGAMNSTSKLRIAVLQHVGREKRAEQLLRRIQRLQVVQSEHHIGHQMKAFISHEQKKLGIPCQLQEKEKAECIKSRSRINAKAELLKSEGVKNLSTAALVNLVRRLETSHSVPSEVLQKSADDCYSKIPNRNVGLGLVVKLDSAESSEITQVTGMLKANVWHLQSSLDSDATESSSGGESCDECDGYEEKKEQPNTPLHKRAAWTWAMDRAAVISRWMWLQAQVSDLEYRIRQHSELFRQLRLAKGSVLLQDIPLQEVEKRTGGSLEQHLSLGVMKNDSHEKQINTSIKEIGSSIQVSGNIPPSAEKTSAKPVNGFVGSSSISFSACNINSQSSTTAAGLCSEMTPNGAGTSVLWSNSGSEIVDNGCYTARTRPIRSFRKRKLLRTADLHTLGKKAAKLSTVGCNCCCQNEVLPCTLCGGRYNNVQTVDPDVMPTSERVSLLDPSFHPVLSFPRDIPLAFHFEVHLRHEKMGRPNHRSVPSIRKKSRLKTSSSYNVNVRRTCKLARNAAQTLLSSAKFRRNLKTKKHCPRRRNITEHSRMPGRSRKQAAVQMAIALKRHRERRRALSLASSGSSRPSSPILSPGSPETSGGMVCVQGTGMRSSLLSELARRKRGESEFDINNIVIPYSIAAATRVERLQYKEILTPKWRYIEDQEAETSGKNNSIGFDTEKVEDMSDEVFAHRHLKCEIEEKKRFMSYLPSQHHGRSRLRSSRMDSRADSSGANTPDPISPHSMDILSQDSFGASGMNSPVATPPATPCPVVIHSDDSQPSGGPVLPPRPERKRSTSFCKRERQVEEFRMMDEDRVITPFEPRTFPLTDEEYQDLVNTSSHLDACETVVYSNDSTDFQNSCNLDPAELSTMCPEQDYDANDPDWSLASEKQSKQSFVLRLAKR